MLQPHNALNHADMDHEHRLMFTSNVRMGKSLTHSTHSMVVGDKCAGLSMSEIGDLLGISLTTVSRVYTESSKKKRKKENI